MPGLVLPDKNYRPPLEWVEANGARASEKALRIRPLAARRKRRHARCTVRWAEGGRVAAAWGRIHEYHFDRRARAFAGRRDSAMAVQPPVGVFPQRAPRCRSAGALDPRAGGANLMATATTSTNRVKGGNPMQRTIRLSAAVMMGLALAAAPTWVSAADEKKATDEKKSTTDSVKTNVSDPWITSKAKIALFADSRVSSTAVNVETQKGTVYLRGKVDNDAAKAAAEEITKGIDGVQSVKNELQVVAPSEKKMVEAKDEDLTKQVKTRLHSDTRLK